MPKTETVVTHPYFSTAIMSSDVHEPLVWTNLHGKFQHHRIFFYGHANKLANILTSEIVCNIENKTRHNWQIIKVEVVLYSNIYFSSLICTSQHLYIHVYVQMYMIF